MKIAKIILLALTTCLTSCYEDYTHDYETTNVGFALQNPLRTVISDRDMPIYVGVSLGGKREVDMNERVLLLHFSPKNITYWKIRRYLKYGNLIYL